jgi:hypothetical protein
MKNMNREQGGRRERRLLVNDEGGVLAKLMASKSSVKLSERLKKKKKKNWRTHFRRVARVYKRVTPHRLTAPFFLAHHSSAAEKAAIGRLASNMEGRAVEGAESRRKTRSLVKNINMPVARKSKKLQ